MPTVSSDTEVCNLALLDLGHQPITSLTETSLAARLCSAFYVPTRDSLLRSHPWNFAIKRVAVSGAAFSDPLSEYSYSYVLPTDFLRMIRTNISAAGFNDEDYRIEYGDGGTALRTNESSLAIEYIARITDAARFDPMFVGVLAKSLAIAMCMKLADNAALKQLLMADLKEMMAGARTSDAMEGTPRVTNDDLWVVSRV